jgi:hypothetical protein
MSSPIFEFSNNKLISNTGGTGVLYSPPICLQVLYKNVTVGANPNEYNVLFISTSQPYGAGIYNCSSIHPGMYTGNNNNGYFTVNPIK